MDRELLLLLGGIKEGVDRLRHDFDDERTNSRDSREKIYNRVEEQSDRISALEKTIENSAKELAELKHTHASYQAEIQPTLAEWKRMKTLGLGFASLIAVGGLSAGSFLMWAGDTAVTAIRHWLKIGG